MLKQLFLEHRTIRRYQSRGLLTPTSYNTLIIFYSSKAKALCIVLIQAYFAFFMYNRGKRISSWYNLLKKA